MTELRLASDPEPEAPSAPSSAPGKPASQPDLIDVLSRWEADARAAKPIAIDRDAREALSVFRSLESRMDRQVAPLLKSKKITRDLVRRDHLQWREFDTMHRRGTVFRIDLTNA